MKNTAMPPKPSRALLFAVRRGSRRALINSTARPSHCRFFVPHILLFSLLLAFPHFAAAAPNEAQAFTAAEKVYLDADYKNAEAYFGEFIQKFPSSIQ